MAWKTVDIHEQRVRFVVAAAQGVQPFSFLCSEFGISRPTGYLWLHRRVARTNSVPAIASYHRSKADTFTHTQNIETRRVPQARFLCLGLGLDFSSTPDILRAGGRQINFRTHSGAAPLWCSRVWVLTYLLFVSQDRGTNRPFTIILDPILTWDTLPPCRLPPKKFSKPSSGSCSAT
jgi:hypothetical protein